jgi:hypothetical protein
VSFLIVPSAAIIASGTLLEVKQQLIRQSVKTALPANIEDEDLIDGQPLRPQPPHIRTGMSFQLARLKFAEITHRQIWQANNNNHPPYSFM